MTMVLLQECSDRSLSACLVGPPNEKNVSNEFHSAALTGTANENGGIAEDSATLPDQTAAQPASEGPVDAAKAETAESSKPADTEAAAAAAAPASSEPAAASTAQPEAAEGAEDASKEAAPASDAPAEASDKPAESAAPAAGEYCN